MLSEDQLYEVLVFCHLDILSSFNCDVCILMLGHGMSFGGRRFFSYISDNVSIGHMMFADVEEKKHKMSQMIYCFTDSAPTARGTLLDHVRKAREVN